MTAQCRRLRQEILMTASNNMDGLIQDAKAKSELAGIQFVLNWPSSLESMLQDEIDNSMEIIQNETDPEA